MVPKLFRMLALASAVLIGCSYIWWAADRKADAGATAAAIPEAADEAAADINPNQADPTHIMVSSKRIEMPVFSSRRGLLPAQEIAPEIQESGEFERFIHYGEPIRLDPFLSEPIKTAIDPPVQKKEDLEPLPGRDLQVVPGSKVGISIDAEALKELGVEFLPTPEAP